MAVGCGPPPPSKAEPMEREQFRRIAKALADPRRFEIFELIAGKGEVGCQHLCGVFPVSQATVSHHLKELSTAGLVTPRREGQFVYCMAHPEVVAAYVSELKRRLHVDAPAARARSR